ncbi:hypothetical protein FRC17_004440, partial [Serendipita sp. 399]
MASSIFASSSPQEDRQICERMAARNLSTSDCESILLLTGISTTSPYYSPPSIRGGIFRYLKERAVRLISRIEKISPISLTSPVNENIVSTTTVTPSKRVPVLDDQHPLSPPISSEKIENIDASSSLLPAQAGPRTLFASLLSYQSTLAVCFASILPSSEPEQSAFAQEQSALVPVEEYEEKRPTSFTANALVVGTPLRRDAVLNQVTDYVTPRRKAQVFGNLVEESSLGEPEAVPLLTPLERAIAQARADGYHLHPRSPLLAHSPSSPVLKLSPPGLVSVKQRYVLRSHQVAASDFFRKEASHRAAVATRNANRGILIGKKDWSMYEPSGLIMPDEEVTRLRVVLSPRRLPVRLWKIEYRGPQDCFEVEERNSTGGPAVFKRNSHLRVELDLTPPSDPAPAYTPSPTSGEAPYAVFGTVEQAEEKTPPPIPGPNTSTPSSKTITKTILCAAEEIEEEPAVAHPSTSQSTIVLPAIPEIPTPSITVIAPNATAQTPSRTPLMNILRALATSARRRRAQQPTASSYSKSKPIDQAAPSVPNPNVISLSKTSPIQRLKAVAFRVIPASRHSSLEVTNRVDMAKCPYPDQQHPIIRPKLSKLQTQAIQDAKPGCLDAALAEAHRRALLNKYFGSAGSNSGEAAAPLCTHARQKPSTEM